MTNLRDELAADQGRPTQCSLCKWLSALAPKDRAEWNEVMADRAYTHASIHRALISRGSVGPRGAVENHRINGHVV